MHDQGPPSPDRGSRDAAGDRAADRAGDVPPGLPEFDLVEDAAAAASPGPAADPPARTEAEAPVPLVPPGLPAQQREDKTKTLNPALALVHRPGATLYARHARGYELALMGLLLAGLLAGLAGSIAASVNLGGLFAPGVTLTALGLLLTVTAVAMGLPVRTLRSVGARSSGGARYDQMQRWTRLKAVSVLLNLLAAVGGLVLLGSLFFRVDAAAVEAPLLLVLRLTTLTTFILLLNHAVCHWMSLRTPMDRPRPMGLEQLVLGLGLAGSAACALMGAVLPAQALDFGIARFDSADAPFFLLASAVLASASLFVARGLPSVMVLFQEERAFYTGHAYLSRSKSVWLPAVMAFALLFLIILVMLVFGVGVAGLAEEVPRNAVLLGVFGFVLVAVVTTLVMTLQLSRREDATPWYQVKATPEQQRRMAILGASAAVSGALFLVAALVGTGIDVGGLPSTAWTDFVAVGLLAAIGPYGFYEAAQRRRHRRLEERFPDLLRDIAAARAAGLTLPSAVMMASRADYGPLSPEIMKMADQLSWGVPFDESLRRFADRVETPLVRRAVALILEAGRSGGNVTDVLLAAANDAREIKNLENERRMSMSLYAAIIYITFFVFLGVVAVLYGTFVPEILRSTSAALAAAGGGSLGFLNPHMPSLEDFRVFFFAAALVQGVGNGVVAGLMESGRPLDGLRHSFIMVLTVWIAFILVAPAGAA